MWPVQTLTLLLSLTDEEQLFAQQQPLVKEIPAIEVQLADPAPVVPADALELFGNC
jgi:hypothetical protein